MILPLRIQVSLPPHLGRSAAERPRRSRIPMAGIADPAPAGGDSERQGGWGPFLTRSDSVALPPPPLAERSQTPPTPGGPIPSG
jgi:hypothetical protein